MPKLFFSKSKLKNAVKKSIAALLVLAMALGSFPMAAFAAATSTSAGSGGGKQAAGDYLWQSLEAGGLGGVENTAQYAGWRFSALKDAYVTELCGYFKGTHSVNLYGGDYNIKASAQITGYDQWNCAAIAPVAVSKGGKYYVIAEISNSPVYYRSGVSLPRQNNDAIIDGGVTQKISQPFGSDIKSNDRRVFGLVDVKITSNQDAQILIKNAGASLAQAADNIAAGKEAGGSLTMENRDGVARNCAHGKCIVCGAESCWIESDEQSKGQEENTFIQICAKGNCWSCTNTDCAKTDATGFVKTGYSFKKCKNNKCINCLNSRCNVTGGQVPAYLYQFDGGFDFGADALSLFGGGGGASGGGTDWGSYFGVDIGGGAVTVDQAVNAIVSTDLSSYSGVVTGDNDFVLDLYSYIGVGTSDFVSETNTNPVYADAFGNYAAVTGNVADYSAGNSGLALSPSVADVANSVGNGVFGTVETISGSAVTDASAIGLSSTLAPVSNTAGSPAAAATAANSVNLSAADAAKAAASLNKGAITGENVKAAVGAYMIDHNGAVPKFTELAAYINTAAGTTLINAESFSDSRIAAMDSMIGVISAFSTTDKATGKVVNNPAAAASTRDSSIANQANGTSFFVSITEPVSKGSTITIPNQMINGQIVGVSSYHVANDKDASIINSQGGIYVIGGSGIKAFGLLNTDTESTVKSGSGSATVSLVPQGKVAGEITQEDLQAGAISVNSAKVEEQSGTVASAVVSDWLPAAFMNTTVAATTKADSSPAISADDVFSTDYSASDYSSYADASVVYIPAAVAAQTITSSAAAEKTASVKTQSTSASAAENSQKLMEEVGSAFTTVDKTTGAQTAGNSAAAASSRDSSLIGWGDPDNLRSDEPTKAATLLDSEAAYNYYMNNHVVGTELANDNKFYDAENWMKDTGAEKESTGASATAGAGVAEAAKSSDQNSPKSESYPGSTQITPSIGAFLEDGKNSATVSETPDTNAQNVVANQGNAAAQPAGDSAKSNTAQTIEDTGGLPLTGSQREFLNSGDEVPLSSDIMYMNVDGAVQWLRQSVSAAGGRYGKVASNAVSEKADYAGLRETDLFFEKIISKAAGSVVAAAENLTAVGANASGTANVVSGAPAGGPFVVDYDPVVTSSQTPAIDIQTDKKAICKAAPYDLEYDLMWNTLATADGKNHQKKFAAQLNEGTYTFYVRCKDEAGNMNMSSQIITFTVDKSFDEKIAANTVPPAIGAARAQVVNSSAIISADIKGEVAVTGAEARVHDENGRFVAALILADGGSGNWSYDWQNIAAIGAGEYRADVFAKDASGNFSEQKNAVVFTVMATGGGKCKDIKMGGSSAKKIDVVFVPCGYGSDFASFESDAARQIEQFSKFTPVAQNIKKFNFRAAEIAGLDCAADLNDNMIKDSENFRQAARICLPDAVMVLKKSSQGPGQGISLAGAGIGFVSVQAPTAAIHELGHAFFNLNDEYSYGCTYVDMAGSPNCTNEPKCEKWKDLAGAGCYAGCTCEGDYRSSNDSVMLDPAHATQFSSAASRQILKILTVFE